MKIAFFPHYFATVVSSLAAYFEEKEGKIKR
jgi:hypothetical protein